ncbi:MAG: NFACT family protein [Clostridia bacterium]|nr:NFACT family protein [Clostridia bacterium]
MDGITLYHIAKELNARLSGARIDRVQQPERDEVILTLRCPGENLSLLLSASADCARAHITNVKKANPLEPPALCMLMRKHLLGGRVTSVRQISADRILAIDAEHTDELGDDARKTVICEFMGKHSNIILVNAEGRILECARHVNETISSFREVLPGLKYVSPPAHGKLCFDSLDEQAVSARLKGAGGSLARILRDNISGLSLPLARELACRAAGDADAVTEDASVYAASVVKAVGDMLSTPSPRVLLDKEGEAKELHPFAYVSRFGEPVREYASLSEAVDDFYRLRDLAERMKQKSASVHRTLKTNVERLQKKLTIQQEAYDSAGASQEYRVKGEMLTASPYLVKKGMKSVLLPNYYDENCAPIRVELDEKLDAAANAQRYFKLYKKAQVARKLAQEQLESGRAELKYLEGQLENLLLCTDEASLEELRQELVKAGYIRETASRRRMKTLPPSKPMEFFSPDGTRILAGRNNMQNEALTFGAEAEEMWLHAKNVPGSHVIVKSASPSDETLAYAAGIAARFSGAGASSGVEVDYTRRRYVKKPSGARPGFVTYTHQHTIVARPLDVQAPGPDHK